MDKPDGGKEVVWFDPEGRKGLNGVSLSDIPLYGIDRLGKDPVVVVAEGEKAAQALVDAGIQAVGTCTGASSVPGRAVLADLTGRKVLLWPDADDVGFEHMRRVAVGLRGIASSIGWVTDPAAQPHDDAVEALQRGGIEGVRALLSQAGHVPGLGMEIERVGIGYRARSKVGRVELRLERIKARSGQVHGELSIRSDDPGAPEDGHLLQHDFNVSSLSARKTTAEYVAKRAPKIEVDWHALLEEFCRRVLALEREGLPIETLGVEARRESIPYLVYPMLPRDRATILFGPGGSGKSYFGALFAIAVATGRSVFPGWDTTRAGNVLILDWEADREEWNDRLWLVAEGAGVDPDEYRGRIRYRSCLTSLTDQVEELVKYVRDERIDLVIVDSVGMASPGAREGTDANEGALQLFRALRLLRTTALLIDHVSKQGAGSENGAKDPYGSIFKTNLARQTWEIKRDDTTEDSPTADLVLTNRKVNNGPKRNPIGVRITYEDRAVVFERTDLSEMAESLQAAIPVTTKIKSALLREGWLTKEALVEETGAAEPTVRQSLLRLTKHGVIVKGPGNQYGMAARTKEDSGDF
jgi:hypothetical protein